MTAIEVLNEIVSHQIEGIMLHAQLADYFDFLDLHGFKRLHEYRYFDESAEMRGVCRFAINRLNKIPKPKPDIPNPNVIPANWYSATRYDVDANTKRRGIGDGMKRWVNWEKQTIAFYEAEYKHLMEQQSDGNIIVASKLLDMINGVSEELKRAERLALELASYDYDLPAVYEMQPCLHEEYKEKLKKIGIEFC